MEGFKAFRMEGAMEDEIAQMAKRDGVSQSDFIRNAVRKEILMRKLDELQAEMVPKARAAGIYTDEDAFRLLESET